MPNNGMTIDSLNALSSLTAQDNVPVWDNEATGEPTKKITAQNFANSVKSLAGLLGTSDVVNNLTSTATDKPLSAAQGKALNDSLTMLSSQTVMMNMLGSVISGAPLTLTIESGSRYILVGFSSSQDRCFILMVRVNNSGSVFVLNVIIGTNISYDTTVANKLTISSTSGTGTEVYALKMVGSIS